MTGGPDQTSALVLNRTFGGRVMLYALIFLWPLIIFGRPSYIPDTVAYLKGGGAAVTFAIDKLGLGTPAAAEPKTAPSATAPPAAGAGEDRDARKPLGTRSPIYSISTYVARFPGQTMLAMALIQILCTAAICAKIAVALGVTRWWQHAVIASLLGLASPIAPYAATVEPDIFAGIATGALILLFTMFERLSLGVRLGLSVLIAYAAASHASIPPLGLGLCLCAAALGLLALFQARRFPLAAVTWMTLAVLFGIGMATMVNLVAFGDANPNAKRWPLALARSVSDGPARWYLEKNCPVHHYAVCEVFPGKFPTTVSGFVFDDTGLHGRATPDQMDRIRAEEMEIVLNAALAYPDTEASKFAEHYGRQLIRFGLSSATFDTVVVTGREGLPTLVTTAVPAQPLLDAVEWTSKALVVISLVLVPLAWRRERAIRDVLILLALASLGNALIAVVFSGVDERYQARMIWLLPLTVIGAVIAGRRRTA